MLHFFLLLEDYLLATQHPDHPFLFWQLLSTWLTGWYRIAIRNILCRLTIVIDKVISLIGYAIYSISPFWLGAAPVKEPT